MTQPRDIASEADRILAAHGGIPTRAAIEAMRQGIATWLAARRADSPATDVVADVRHARRLLMEAMDRVQQGRGIG